MLLILLKDVKASMEIKSNQKKIMESNNNKDNNKTIHKGKVWRYNITLYYYITLFYI